MSTNNTSRDLAKLVPRQYVQKLTSTLLAVIVIVFTSFIAWAKDAQADYFKCYTDCSPALEDSSECKKSEDEMPGDYKTVERKGIGDVVVLAIHGGAIE